eukprot:TRINITY_DN11080_c0_g1_i2.p1 TRINITY_DN11080_c0_g1~~TRINITY_DN11080_c0_g1_i2.p1  ORF type:complete len:125 (-),score=18.22 TRINITY_DN11080_c0_g1_i2:100-474(-)
MVFTAELGAQLIEEEVQTWARSYVYSIQLERETDDEMHFCVVFSKPAERLPIPDVVVRVYFTISNFTQPILTYFIENQRIVHDAEQTKFQEHWLDYVVAQKKTLSSAMGPTPSERLKPAEINRP